MGMIQIDMEMPKVCDDCPFMDEDHGDYPYCIALGQNRGYTFRIREKRFPNCPLKPVEEQKENTEIERYDKELMKNKEPVMVRSEFNNMCNMTFHYCGACGDGLPISAKRVRFCPWCGKPVKWE